MDLRDSTFTALLAKFPIVRSKDAVLPPPRRKPGFFSSAAPAPPRAALLPAPPAAAPGGAPPADFWTGLNDFLVARVGAASAKAIAASFDTLHCAFAFSFFRAGGGVLTHASHARHRTPARADASLRALNYEDAEDLIKMMARELKLPLEEAAPSS